MAFCGLVSCVNSCCLGFDLVIWFFLGLLTCCSWIFFGFLFFGFDLGLWVLYSSVCLSMKACIWVLGRGFLFQIFWGFYRAAW